MRSFDEYDFKTPHKVAVLNSLQNFTMWVGLWLKGCLVGWGEWGGGGEGWEVGGVKRFLVFAKC